MITQARVRDLFVYDPTTGWLTNKITRNPNARIGDRAGTIRYNGYRQVAIAGSIYLEHRIIWMYVYGYFPEEVDHKNGVRDDNKLTNLRACTCSQNRKNSARDVGTSGLRGVSPNKSATRWRARIWVDGTEFSLGEYDSPKEARLVYLTAAEQTHGEFAFHNRPFNRRI